ncbi:hypothetical protein GCM10011410_04470 [Hoyosella rhizosphaerae]|uniref:Uncharacterized protein n=1 Tax=Hoyosella rhizosphaerae TaxID=1755582 RepID=A0A916U0V7_9ACTN|nr:hypothetical protein GCM10011410_04470 [Hoyosella rhizosphaerae]
MEADRIPHLKVLAMREDLVRVGDPAADEIFKKFVAIKASATLPNLHDPRPHLSWWRINRDPVRVAPAWIRQ